LMIWWKSGWNCRTYCRCHGSSWYLASMSWRSVWDVVAGGGLEWEFFEMWSGDSGAIGYWWGYPTLPINTYLGKQRLLKKMQCTICWLYYLVHWRGCRAHRRSNLSRWFSHRFSHHYLSALRAINRRGDAIHDGRLQTPMYISLVMSVKHTATMCMIAISTTKIVRGCSQNCCVQSCNVSKLWTCCVLR
jgi:hypothetical protein